MSRSSSLRRIRATLLTVLALAAPALAQTLTLTATLQDGAVYSTELDGARRWSMFRGDPTPRAPDGLILGAHIAKWEERSSDLVLGGVRVSNAAANPDGSGHPGKTYYRSIAMKADGWNVLFDIQRAPQPFLVAPGEHVFLDGAAFVRRFALYRGTTTAQAARAALDSVPEFDITKPFFPQGVTLPTINVGAQQKHFAGKLDALRAALNSGNASPPNDLRRAALRDPNTGSFCPFDAPGNEVAYEHGGQGIFFVYGWQQAPSAALFWRTISDLFIERMRFVYDKTSGARITPEMWAVGAKQPFQPFSIFLHGDPDQTNTEGRHEYLPPAFDVPPFNAGKCAYEAPLRRVKAIDGAHLIRAVGPACADWWRTQDPIAREAILDYANWCRMAYCDIGLPAGRWRSGLPTLFSWAKPPNAGRPSLGREFGWVMFTHAAALAVMQDTDAEWRWVARNAAALLRLRATASMPNGLPQRQSIGGIAAAWDPKTSGGGGAPADRDLAQSFEQAIVFGGELALMRYVSAPAENLDCTLRGARSLYDNPKFPNRPVPWKYVTVGMRNGAALETLSEGFNVPGMQWGDSTHVTRTLAELYRKTGDTRWLDLLCGTKPRAQKRLELAGRIAKPTPGYEPEWDVEALAVLQNAAQ